MPPAPTAEERSTLIGVHLDWEVVACIEVRPDGTVRQFLGPANRPPAPRLEAAVIAALIRHHVVTRPPPGR